MTIRLLVGDCRATLATLPARSVQACVTSPPYYGLRDYGLRPLVWSGDAEHEHAFGPLAIVRDTGRRDTARRVTGHGVFDDVASEPHATAEAGSSCVCGAWLGSLGLEPTPELYIEHLVEIFRQVRRVLSDSGTVWCNLGDSYSGSGNGSNDHRENGSSLSKNDAKYQGQKPAASLPAKNLMMLPFRVALALQADGWYLRSVIPWLKRNSMPESVTDRPSTAVEYVFLLSKNARYYWDADAVRVANTDSNTSRLAAQRKYGMTVGPENVPGAANPEDPHYPNRGKYRGLPGVGTTMGGFDSAGRNRRNSDWFFESWQGMLLDEHDDPLALVVNPAPYKEAHYATFPLKLVEPMVKASTKPGDTCLDCFGGSGTVGLVADRLDRNAILCELKDSYGQQAVNRVMNDAPMFADLDVS